jgi:hypothetical protein
MSTAPFDGMIYGVEEYSTRDGRNYYRILHYGQLEDDTDLVQFSTRAAYYVERYGREQSVKNARAYDATFDIFENLDNSRKIIEGNP